VVVDPDRVQPLVPQLEVDGEPYRHSPSGHLLAPNSLEFERTLFTVRLPLAKLYSRQNGLNRITVNPSDAHRGIVAAGKSYTDLMSALGDAGITEDDLGRSGVRVLKIGMLYPLDEQVVSAFGSGLDEVLVIEDKLEFLEDAVRVALYGMPDAPQVVGKRDGDGAPLLPATGELDADVIGGALARWLPEGLVGNALSARAAALSARARPPQLPVLRSAFFCSGCPHNRSTDVPDGTAVGVGIGCHTMVLLSREDKGHLVGMTQMGGEGAQWIGMAPFTDHPHFTQNLGDGTFHHSGSLAIRAAIAAGVNITYKVLYNEAVAMTGGQSVEGVLSVPAMTRSLAQEGVERIVVTTDEPERYRGVALDPIATVRDRRDLEEVQRELAAIPGVTVLIHDQRCAAEKRRLHKRGKLPDPPQRVYINERVCEGCGDCGRKSDCLSVVPVETLFGRKTRIDQSSCNKDFSCLDGDCPSFLTVIPPKDSKRRRMPPQPPVGDLPTPEPCVPADFTVRMPGIGGTGVVTISQILGMAARLDGRHVWGLDQTGLSQKGGPVVSDVHVSSLPITGSNKASGATVDLLLGLDILGAAHPTHLLTCDPSRTVAVVSTSHVATGHMVMNPQTSFPDDERTLRAIKRATRGDKVVLLDARAISEALFGDTLPANMLVLGAAYQTGALPLSLEAFEGAIRLNGAGVEDNLAAFAWGRAAVANPAALEERIAPPRAEQRIDPRASALVDGLRSEIRSVVEGFASELIGFQSLRLARVYVRSVREVADAEQRALPGRDDLAKEYARGLYKLMAYKDEYEVARLHLDPVERARLEAEFGKGAKVAFNLHPPLLRAMGLDRKVKLGAWFTPAFVVLRSMRRLRGTLLDPFGHAEVRKVERALIADYRDEVGKAVSRLSAETYDTVLAVCGLPEMIRGYENVKLANVAKYHDEKHRLREALMDRTVTVSDRRTPAVLSP
jgi:indolepyruvate ferredoxin oxidoreductase